MNKSEGNITVIIYYTQLCVSDTFSGSNSTSNKLLFFCVFKKLADLHLFHENIRQGGKGPLRELI